jgi:hypothetical protein
VPSGEHYLVSSKHQTGVHHFVVRCAVWLFFGPLVQSCTGEELLHDVQATDVPLADSSVPAGGGLVKDAIGPLLSRHNCFARSAAPSHGGADGTPAWWWANRQLLQSAAGARGFGRPPLAAAQRTPLPEFLEAPPLASSDSCRRCRAPFSFELVFVQH